MATNIELSLEADGRWAARVPAVPGLAAFGDTQEESLAVAKNVAAILLRAGDRRGSIILGFYPGRIPNDTRAKVVPPAQ